MPWHSVRFTLQTAMITVVENGVDNEGCRKMTPRISHSGPFAICRASWSGLGQGPLYLDGASHIERCHPAVVLGMRIGRALHREAGRRGAAGS